MIISTHLEHTWIEETIYQYMGTQEALSNCLLKEINWFLFTRLEPLGACPDL